jgi:hypothetical protein
MQMIIDAFKNPIVSSTISIGQRAFSYSMLYAQVLKSGVARQKPGYYFTNRATPIKYGVEHDNQMIVGLEFLAISVSLKPPGYSMDLAR